MTIQWTHLKEPVTYKQCYSNLPPRGQEVQHKIIDDIDSVVSGDDDDDEPAPAVNHRKISEFRFTTDPEQAKLDKDIEHL